MNRWKDIQIRFKQQGKVKMNMKRLSILITLCLSANYAFASEVTDEQINTFVSGEAAIAEEVNQNFTALKDGINDNNSRIGVVRIG